MANQLDQEKSSSMKLGALFKTPATQQQRPFVNEPATDKSVSNGRNICPGVDAAAVQKIAFKPRITLNLHINVVRPDTVQ